MEDRHGRQTVEGVVVHHQDAGVVQVQHTQVLPPDKSVTLQATQAIPVQIDLCGVHRDLGRQLGGGVIAVALDNVVSPGGVAVAGAAHRAGHLAVAGIIVATVTESEAVRLIGAQEILWSGIDQGHKRPAL